MQTTQFRVRVNEDNSATLRRLAGDSGVQPIDIATMLLHAAVAAVRENGGKIHLPPRFKVIEETSSRYEFNEKAAKRK